MEGVLLEGAVKFREGKKWKARWCAARRLSPAAGKCTPAGGCALVLMSDKGPNDNCVELHLYSEARMRLFRGSGTGATKASLALQHFFGFESCFTLDKESNTLALLCRELVVVLAFERREQLIQWQIKLAAQLGESRQFSVLVATDNRMPTGPARLHLLGRRFALTSGTPPRLLGSWELVHLRRYGIIDDRFCFEGGTLCGVHAGLHVLLADRPRDIVEAFNLAAAVKHRKFIQNGDLKAQFENGISKNLHLHWKSTKVRGVADDVQQKCSRSPKPERREVPARCSSCVAKLGSSLPSSTSPLTPATPRLPPQLPTASLYKPTWKMEKNRVKPVERFLLNSVSSECITQTASPYKNYDKPKSIYSKGPMWTTLRATQVPCEPSGSSVRVFTRTRTLSDTEEDEFGPASFIYEKAAHRTHHGRPRHHTPEPHTPAHVYSNVDVVRKIRLQTELERGTCEPTKIMRRARSNFPIDEEVSETYEIIRYSPRLRGCVVSQTEGIKNYTETACTNYKRAQKVCIISAQEKRSEFSNTMDHYLLMDPDVVYLRMRNPINDLCSSSIVILEELARKRFCNITKSQKGLDDLEFQKRSRSAESFGFLQNLEESERRDTPFYLKMEKNTYSYAIDGGFEHGAYRNVDCCPYNSNDSNPCSPHFHDTRANILWSSTPSSTRSSDADAILNGGDVKAARCDSTPEPILDNISAQAQAEQTSC